MEKKKMNAIVLAIVVVSSVAIIALWFPATQPDVRIGYLNQDLHQLAVRVALENGWFEEEGLNVQLLQFGNGAYEMDGFLGGQIDMGYLGAAPAMTKSINQDIGITILAAVNLEGSAIMVHKDEYDAGRIANMSDLTGKTVYHPGPSTVQNFLLRLALNQSGMSVDDVSLETARPQDMAISLTPTSPAFIAWEPFPALAEYEDLAVPLVLSGEIWSRHPCCVVATSNSFLEAHPDRVQKVIDVHKRAEEWIVDNPMEALAIAVDWLGADEEAVETAFDRIIYDYNLNRTGLERYLEFLIHEELVEMSYDAMDAFLDGFINGTFIESS
ncbi:ABC transporter substrate-binding protein [Candidatus Thorarchaeota archaeon]|nr:MAG: ABC transporter substrate-binding protein [Candidatus Thorarchaeota archaeon]